MKPEHDQALVNQAMECDTPVSGTDVAALQQTKRIVKAADRLNIRVPHVSKMSPLELENLSGRSDWDAEELEEIQRIIDFYNSYSAKDMDVSEFLHLYTKYRQTFDTLDGLRKFTIGRKKEKLAEKVIDALSDKNLSRESAINLARIHELIGRASSSTFNFNFNISDKKGLDEKVDRVAQMLVNALKVNRIAAPGGEVIDAEHRDISGPE